MNPELFGQIRLLSEEIRSLLRQGVREGVNERIQTRDQLLRQWFAEIQSLMDMTREQQDFLEQLLEQERALLEQIRAEQTEIADQQRNRRKMSSYQNISRH